MNQPEYIYAGWLIDGSGGAIQKKMILTIIKGRVTNIDRFNKSNSPPPERTTDLSHCTILPPLVDAHVHLSMSGSVDPQIREQQLTAGYTDIEPVIARHIHYHFTHGVLAVRDGGDRRGHTLQYKNEHSGSSDEPVILKVAGKAWHAEGRYGSQLGRHPAENETLAAAYCRDKDLVEQVKLINSGPNSLRVFGRETPPQFDQDEMTQFVRLAAQKGKKVMVHANGKTPVRMALEAGCHSIEHGYFMGRENLQMMADKQISWVPTLVAMKACAENIDRDGIHTYKGVAAENLYHQMEQLSLAREMGVPIVVGTDSGSPGVLHGEAVVNEIRIFLKAGFSMPEAIQCATSNGAQLLGLEQKMGIIAKDRPAHFIVVRGTPAQMPRKLSYLEAIYRGGTPCEKGLYNKI